MYLLYYKNVDFQDIWGICSAAKFKQMTSLELNTDCGLKYVSAWRLHISIAYLFAAAKWFYCSFLSKSSKSLWNIIRCHLLFRMAASQISVLNCLNVCCSSRIRSHLKNLQQSSLLHKFATVYLAWYASNQTLGFSSGLICQIAQVGVNA